jgi:serine/threonine-protein kinase
VTTLTRLGLEAVLRNVPSAEPAGLVVAQNPPAGKEVDKGSSVTVNISSGTGPGTTTLSTTTVATTTTATTVTTTAARVRVPTVRGLAVTTGLRRLNAAQFRPVVRYVASSQPAGRVVFQAPAGGTAPRGSRVRVNVSTGPNPAAAATVPDVVGQDQAAAATALREAGFRVLVLNRRTADQAQNGLVLEQQPGAGANIPRGSYVAIFVGRFTS